MELQTAFETIARHLFAQGHRAVDLNGACQYRAKDGSMCAIGVLIPDNAYNPGIEGNGLGGVIDLVREGDLRKNTLPEVVLENEVFFGSLQYIHDFRPNWDTSEKLSDALIDLGSDYDLSVEFIDGLYFGMTK